MGKVYFIWFVSVALAILYSQNIKKYSLIDISHGKNRLSSQPWAARFLFFALCLYLINFAGLRTVGNDTALYIVSFERLKLNWSDLSELDLTVGANPLFQLWMVFIKSFTKNSQWFIYLTAIFTVGSSLEFVRRYSKDFNLAVFVFIGSTTYSFMLAAMKQTMAVAIAIWAIPLALKKKWIRAFLLIFIAMLIHPYVFVIAVVFFLTDNVWDKKTGLIVLGTVVGVFFLDSILNFATNIAEAVGDEYSDLGADSGTGVNIFRLLVYTVVPLLSYIGRDNLRKRNSKLINLSINGSVISFCFMLVARFTSPILIGRIPSYFDVLSCVALPYSVQYSLKSKKIRYIIVFVAVIGYILYFYKYYSKYTTSLYGDLYRHVKFSALFGGAAD